MFQSLCQVLMIMMMMINIYQVLMSEVRRFGRDFDSRQLTKTLTLKFERLQSKINTTFLSENYKWKQAHHQPFQVHSRGRCGGYDQLQQEVDQLCRGAHQKGT